MANCIFTNLTAQQARTLAEWFSGQGEQDAEIWFEANEVESPLAHKITTDENFDTIVECR